MTWVSWYACNTPSTSSLKGYGTEKLNLVGGYIVVCQEPWGLATMFDAYFGFMAFWLYVALRENNNFVRFGWWVALMLLGNFAIAGYALSCLLGKAGESNLTKIFFTKKSS
jgi:hypothetical protein